MSEAITIVVPVFNGRELLENLQSDLKILETVTAKAP